MFKIHHYLCTKYKMLSHIPRFIKETEWFKFLALAPLWAFILKKNSRLCSKYIYYLCTKCKMLSHSPRFIKETEWSCSFSTISIYLEIPFFPCFCHFPVLFVVHKDHVLWYTWYSSPGGAVSGLFLSHLLAHQLPSHKYFYKMANNTLT